MQPGSGFALNTSFLLSTDLWVEDDLPLAYTFSFQSIAPATSSGSATVVFLALKAKSEVATTSALLPSGAADQNHMVNKAS